MYGRGNVKTFKQQLITWFMYGGIIACVTGGVWWFSRDNIEFDDIIHKIAMRHGVDPLLVKAVIWRESKFKVHARGSSGEFGLMQIMPKSATGASVVLDWERAHKTVVRSEGNLLYPETNIEIGTWYLAKSIAYWKDYKDKYEIGLSTYNAGKKPVNGWIKGMDKDETFIDRIRYDSTKGYVKSIMVKYHYYKMEEHEKY